jgi:hypothetical protein
MMRGDTEFVRSGILHPGHLGPGDIGIVKSKIIPRGSFGQLNEFGVSALVVPLKIMFSIERNGVNENCKWVYTTAANPNYIYQAFLSAPYITDIKEETCWVCTIENLDNCNITIPYVYFNYSVTSSYGA